MESFSGLSPLEDWQTYAVTVGLAANCVTVLVTDAVPVLILQSVEILKKSGWGACLVAVTVVVDSGSVENAVTVALTVVVVVLVV